MRLTLPGVILGMSEYCSLPVRLKMRTFGSAPNSSANMISWSKKARVSSSVPSIDSGAGDKIAGGLGCETVDLVTASHCWHYFICNREKVKGWEWTPHGVL